MSERTDFERKQARRERHQRRLDDLEQGPPRGFHFYATALAAATFIIGIGYLVLYMAGALAS